MRNGIYLYSSFIAELYFRWIIWHNNGGVSLSLQEKLCRIIEFVFASVRFPRISQLEKGMGEYPILQCPALETLKDCAGIPESADQGKAAFHCRSYSGFQSSVCAVKLCWSWCWLKSLSCIYTNLFLIVSPAQLWPTVWCFSRWYPGGTWAALSQELLCAGSVDADTQFWERMKSIAHVPWSLGWRLASCMQQCRCNPGGGLHNGAGAEFAASGSEGQTWCREGAKSPDGGKAGTGPEVSTVTVSCPEGLQQPGLVTGLDANLQRELRYILHFFHQTTLSEH